MAKYRSLPHWSLQPLLFFSRKVPFSTSPLSIEHPPISAATTQAFPHEIKATCFSELEQLIRRGLINPAEKLVQKIVRHSSSVPEAVSAVDFALSRGVELDMKSYGFLIRKLLTCDEAKMAEAVYVDFILNRGIEPDHFLLNSMVVCYSKLGKLEESKSQFDRLLKMEVMPCRAACSDIITAFCAQNRFLEGFDVFLAVHDAEFLLHYRCYNRLVDGLSSIGNLNEALYVYDIMCDKSVPPTIHLLKTLVFMLCRNERVEEAEFLSMETESFGFFIDKVMYTALINGYCRKGRMKMALRLFYRMLKLGCHPDNYTCNTLIHGFVKTGMIDKIFVLFHQMKELGLKLNVVSYQIMISKCCKDLKVDCALTLLHNMMQCNLAPTVHCYTPLLAALVKENRLAEADQYYNQLFDSGLFPDDVLFFTVAKNCVGHEIDLAHNFVTEIGRHGCDISSTTYSSSSSKSVDDIILEIDMLLEEIYSRNSGLARVAFNIHIIAMCYAGKLDAAELCMDKMSTLSLQPSLLAYNSMIWCLCQMGLGNDVISILDQLEATRVKPTVAMYDSIIGCLAREKRVLEASQLFDRMHEVGLFPDETVYVTMISGLSKNRQAGAARELFDKMLKYGIRPSYRAYTALINGLVKQNMIQEGHIYLSRMLEEGFMPNAALYTSLIYQYFRKGEIRCALKLVVLMEKSHIKKDVVTHVALVSGVCRNIRYISRKCHKSQRQSVKAMEMLYHLLCEYTNLPGQKDLENFIISRVGIKAFALKLIGEVKKGNFIPNLYLHNSVIAGLCWANDMEGAYNHLDVMQKEGLLPNHVTLTILIDGHFRKGKTDLAVNLFNKMNEHDYVLDDVVYNMLIKGFCKAGRPRDALSVSNIMLKKGHSLSKASYENLLQLFCANRWTVHALKILEDMVSCEYTPCRGSLNWLLWILCEENKFIEACNVRTLKSRIRVLSKKASKGLFI
ncbi:unnamed protein product [Cuscuta europaea]|uniref:Pentatricopeptide repeat-containing protein n=1 Tax=Cuscuta europaea TaxID=41803 RepID=A0A9P0ZVH4_CUSEU|nr:unnamed protein product [Cuscuta europaea]